MSDANYVQQVGPIQWNVLTDEQVGRARANGEAMSFFNGQWLATVDALTARAERAEASVAKIRAYAIESAAVCREAEEKRRSDLSKRENGTIADMLREQTFAWGEKAKSYDALVVFIDALLDAAGGMGQKCPGCDKPVEGPHRFSCAVANQRLRVNVKMKPASDDGKDDAKDERDKNHGKEA